MNDRHLNELNKIAELSEKLYSKYVSVDLRCSFLVPFPSNFNPTIEKEIKYYNNSIYPSMEFMKWEGVILESREIVESFKIDNITYELAIEQSYISNQIKFPLVYYKTKNIRKQILQTIPVKIELVEYENIFKIEIIFTKKTLSYLFQTIKNYKIDYWPVVKPKEVTLETLKKELKKNTQWILSYKIDGIHALYIEREESSYFLFDSGKIQNLKGENVLFRQPKNVYEIELIDDIPIFFDCIMYDYKLTNNLNYIERYNLLPNYYPKNSIVSFQIGHNYKDVKSFMFTPPPFKIDGFMINHFKYKDIRYKSKFIPTMDLLCSNGMLLFRNETISNRIPEFEAEEGKIYEVTEDLKLVSIRNDKLEPNTKLTSSINPIYNIIFCTRF